MKSIAKLKNICDIESTDKKVGWRARRDELDKWLNLYTDDIEVELGVVNAEVFSTDAMDLVKEQLAKHLAEELTTSIKYEINGNKIKAKMKVIRYLKED